MLALLTLLAGTALAEAPPPPDVLPSPINSDDRRTGPFSRDTYPSEVSARPLTLPAGMFRGDAFLDARYLRLTTTTWQFGLGLSLAFAPTHNLEVAAFSTLALAPVAARRAGASGTYLLVDGEVLDLAVQARLQWDLSGVVPATEVVLAFPGRLLLEDRIFLTFGAELLRVRLAVPFPLVALRLGLGVQVSSGVAISAETDVVKSIGPNPAIPLDLAVTVAVARGFDLQVRAGVFSLANPRLSGTFALAGSAYF